MVFILNKNIVYTRQKQDVRTKYGRKLRENILVTEIINKPTCKYCGSSTVCKCGSYNGVQRYLCKSCGKKFKADNHLFYMRVPSEYVSLSLEMYYHNKRQSDIRNYLSQRYGYLPNKVVIGQWIHKFTERANRVFGNYLPGVGDTWIISEILCNLAGKKYRIYDIVDIQTRFLLSTQISLTRSGLTIEKLMEEAEKKAGKRPARLSAFVNYTCFDQIQKIIRYPLDHIIYQPQELKYDVDLIDCCLRNCDRRQTIIGNTRSVNGVNILLDGWNIFYNYFQRQNALNNKTPAETAGIDYPIKSWQDFIIHDSRCPPETNESD